MAATHPRLLRYRARVALSDRDRRLAWAVPVLMVAVAVGRMGLARMADLSPWKGAGFGMFSTVDGVDARFVRVTRMRQGAVIPLRLPPNLEQRESRLRAAWWRNGLLLLFVAAVYAIAPVIGFGSVLTAMGYAQCREDERRWRIAFLLGFILLQAYRACRCSCRSGSGSVRRRREVPKPDPDSWRRSYAFPFRARETASGDAAAA